MQADRVLCDTSLNEADWRPGDYPVVIGFYQEASGARLPVVAADLEHDGVSVTIGTLRVR